MQSTIQDVNVEINPRIIYEALGSKIIELDSIAIAEQIKNASDAGAPEIIVDFSLISNDIITISDNGIGMTYLDIKKNWFFIGTDNKNENYDQLGGKGIGRFSLFRLANIIEIETISNGIKSNFVFDKNLLQQENNTSNIKIKVVETPTTNNNTGTKITLKEVNKKLNIPEIQKELENLNTPDTPKTYNIVYPKNINLINYLKPNEAINDAPMIAEVYFKGNKIVSYDFSCIVDNKNLYSNSDISKIEKSISKYDNIIDLGLTKLYVANFFFDNTYKVPMKYGHNTLTNRFLAAYQGINVYRNNYKIYGHGEEDWLKLAEKRLVKASQNIDNKQTFGYIILDSFESKTLEEKQVEKDLLKTIVIDILNFL